MERIRSQMVVEREGRRGVTVDDLPGMMGCCADWETPVVWDGEGVFQGTRTEELKVVGPEGAEADLSQCGAGRGADCCVFLAMGSGGPHCERHGGMRWSLIFRVDRMTAKRQPVEAYPACRKFPPSEGRSKSLGESNSCEQAEGT